ncbi:MAG: hypothetical protein IJQ39_14020 [Thermoguttaceae bacterium]|nr:hypothetical protein [Thermoguttaceae bacterium]
MTIDIFGKYYHILLIVRKNFKYAILKHKKRQNYCRKAYKQTSAAPLLSSTPAGVVVNPENKCIIGRTRKERI